jgi:predicted aldo/keto reductase-like oxidoreductase
VTYVDTAHNYDKAEECIGKALGKLREKVFLTTKVWADDAATAKQSLDESLQTLRTDHVDLVFLHSLGNRDVERATGPDGALSHLLRAKETGKARFVGLSGHCRAGVFVPVVERGEIDVIMVAMNFVDRQIYNFEEQLLPAANKRHLGIAAMKVFGGIRGGFPAATKPNPGPQLDTPYLQQAVNYALSLPGVATLVIGVHTIEQLRQNVQMVKSYTPLTDQAQKELAELGRRLAPQWGPRHGPAV